jgi:hypothetical protein
MPDGSHAAASRAFDALLNGRGVREDFGFGPKFLRFADAVSAGADALIWREALIHLRTQGAFKRPHIRRRIIDEALTLFY